MPADRETLRRALAGAMPDELGPVGLARRAIPQLEIERVTTGYGDQLIDALLPVVEQAVAASQVELVAYLQERRRAALNALRANVSGGADYWRWQGHAELARQLLERLGAEVPR